MGDVCGGKYLIGHRLLDEFCLLCFAAVIISVSQADNATTTLWHYGCQSDDVTVDPCFGCVLGLRDYNNCLELRDLRWLRLFGWPNSLDLICAASKATADQETARYLIMKPVTLIQILSLQKITRALAGKVLCWVVVVCIALRVSCG